MKRIQVLLLFIVISCSMFAQDRLSLFIGRANKYAAVELSDYRKRLCVEYNIIYLINYWMIITEDVVVIGGMSVWLLK